MDNINRKSNGVELKSMKIDCHEAGLLGIPDENSDNKQHNTEKQSTEKTCNGTPEKNVSAQTNIDIVDIDDEKDEKLQDPLSVKTNEHESDHDNEDDDDVGLDGLYSASASSEKINGQAPISKRLCVYLLGCVLAGVLLVVIVMLNITDKPESTSTDTFFDEDIDRDPSSWALWTDWSQCSLTCGTGNTTRYRTLDRHAEYVGDGSGGIEILRQTEIEECVLKSCPVDGGLSQWALWSLCSSDCGPGIQIRHRECTDPIPKHGGRNCTGKTQVTRKCLLKPCPVDGGFTLWSSWSVCSVTCGTGLKSRDRTCSNPPPQYSGVPCTGPVQDIELCGGTRCPVHGAFSLWSDWTLCTVSCGTGIQTRRRACDNPPPADGGWDCAGRRFEKQTCTLPECPVDGDWATWSEWTQCTWSCGSVHINTITLKWCTPKSNIQDLPACTGAYRITPVDVNSRPSSCLTNFLLSGRAVMLEQPRKTGVKVMSHMLTSHGGEIFIHTIPTCRSILEDPPSISEGPGGRVTDYRIPDFREFMKDCRLAPASPAVAELAPQLPIMKALQYLERTSRYWPMVISDTIIFNMASHIDPLPSLLVKERLTEDDVVECKKAIYHVVGLETQNEPLPVSITGARGKGSKREQQYAQMWSELESLIRAYTDTSPMHQKILDCLLECKKPSDEAKGRKLDKSGAKEESSETDSAWNSLDRFQRMTDQDRKEYNRMDSVDEFGPPSKRLRPGFTEPLIKTGVKQSLMSMWNSRMKSVHSKRHVEFIGRQENQGTIAQLYQHMFQEEDMDEMPAGLKK